MPMLDMDSEALKDEIVRVRKMKEIIQQFVADHQLVKDREKSKMITLQDKSIQFETYCRKYLAHGDLTKYYGEPLLVICYDKTKTKNSKDDLIFTTKGIERFESDMIFSKRHCFPVKYSHIITRNNDIHIGTHVIKHSSNTLNVNALYELICLLKMECDKDDNNAKTIINSNLADKIVEQINQSRVYVDGDLSEATNQSLDKNSSYDTATKAQEIGSIQQRGERHSKNADGSFWVDGTVASEHVICNEFCYIDGSSSKYHVREIRFEGWQTNNAKKGQTASFRLYDSSM